MGLCGNKTAPLQGSGDVEGLLPKSITGTLTIYIDEPPEVSIDSGGKVLSGSLDVTIGGNPAALRRVVFFTASRTVLEVVPDVKPLDSGITSASVEFKPGDLVYKSTFSVTVYNDAITMTFLENTCEGSYEGGAFNTKLALVNFAVNDPAGRHCQVWRRHPYAGEGRQELWPGGPDCLGASIYLCRMRVLERQGRRGADSNLSKHDATFMLGGQAR